MHYIVALFPALLHGGAINLVSLVKKIRLIAKENRMKSDISHNSGIHKIQAIPGGILKIRLCCRVALYA